MIKLALKNATWSGIGLSLSWLILRIINSHQYSNNSCLSIIKDSLLNLIMLFIVCFALFLIKEMIKYFIKGHAQYNKDLAQYNKGQVQ